MHEAENYNRYLLNVVRKHAPDRGRILDFGAGSGQFSAPLARLGFHVTALEPDNALRDSMLQKGIPVAANINELDDCSFEYIYSLNVLEHITDDVGALTGIRTKLASGGALLLYVPAFPTLYTSMDARVGHVRRYTRDSLLSAVQSAGFCTERVGYVDSIGYLATLIFKAVDNKTGHINRAALRAYDRFVFPISVALDTVTKLWFGKNLLLVARKP
jgi:SAM-dependent methyltransferase